MDVRFESESRRGAIPGSLSVPLHRLRARLAEIPPGPVLVYCQTGLRSSTAASLLELADRTEVLDLIGGFAAWNLDARTA